jgi:hypothetical protein
MFFLSYPVFSTAQEDNCKIDSDCVIFDQLCFTPINKTSGKSFFGKANLGNYIGEKCRKKRPPLDSHYVPKCNNHLCIGVIEKYVPHEVGEEAKKVSLHSLTEIKRIMGLFPKAVWSTPTSKDEVFLEVPKKLWDPAATAVKGYVANVDNIGLESIKGPSPIERDGWESAGVADGPDGGVVCYKKGKFRMIVSQGESSFIFVGTEKYR